ncbi:regulator [bacterium LRH843]|nr:regulator [bacterium LRH843]
MISRFLGVVFIVASVWGSSFVEGNQNNEFEGPKIIDVILQRVYLDGEKSEERMKETVWQMDDFWAAYEDWTFISQNEHEIIFRQEVKDISPLLKINGYFGLTEEGVLSIYEGEPNNENIIQSFFQLDTKKLKSKQQKELVRGIPVRDLDRYQEVLQVFGQMKLPSKE